MPVLDLAEQSGFIVPKLLKSTQGRYIEEGWTCEPFLDGRMFQTGELNRIGSRLQLLQVKARNVLQRPGFLAASDLIGCDFGGDIDLRVMREDVVALCRGAWSQIANRSRSLVHGDLNASNLIWTVNGGIGLIDWDEARVDATLFDDFHAGLHDRGGVEEMAVLAWEIASSWLLEPEYARRMAEKLRP
jgi:hypothetical protein